MPSEADHTGAPPTGEVAGAERKPPGRARVPWVTALAIFGCIAVFLAIVGEGAAASWETLSRCGYLPAWDIWDGGWWALLTSAFVHIEIWHLAFNVYWLWVLGSRLERTIG
ncbi:MAG: rhomboid family intramembrane serine protease, partial [Planctomycetota bacterium]